MKLTPAVVNRPSTEFSILNAVSSDDDDSCSSDDSDGEADIYETPDDVIYTGSKPTFVHLIAQKSADCKPAVRPVIY